MQGSHARVGRFQSVRHNKWWTITEDTDVERIYAEFETVFKEDVLPWLDQFNSWDDVIRVGRQGGFRYMFCSSLYR